MLMDIEVYLKENIDDHIKISHWQDEGKVSMFLRSLYNFYELKILDKSCVLLEMIDGSTGVDGILKHIKLIGQISDHEVVLFYRDISQYRRKSLIGKRIPFIIGNGQMFLPFLGLDLKKPVQFVEMEETVFTPSTQVAYLFFLYNKHAVVNAMAFADMYGFTEMTASRALNDLYHAKLITYEIGGKTGRSKEYRRIADPDYFIKGKVFIKSPVKKVVYVRDIPDGALIAGLEALSSLSMINPSNQTVRAISQLNFKKTTLDIIKNKDFIQDEKCVAIEIWSYDPILFSDKQHVDLLSLYASLKDDKDERIELAMVETLRGEPWYMDLINQI